ncbi:hypothetical protein L195_g064731, partial [Trifolium pratense]
SFQQQTEQKQSTVEVNYAGGVVQSRAASCKWRKEVPLEYRSRAA